MNDHFAPPAEAAAAASHIITCKKVNDSKQLTARKRWSSPTLATIFPAKGGRFRWAVVTGLQLWFNSMTFPPTNVEFRRPGPGSSPPSFRKFSPRSSDFTGVSSGPPLRISWLPGREVSKVLRRSPVLHCVAMFVQYQKAEFKRYKICIQITTHSPGPPADEGRRWRSGEPECSVVTEDRQGLHLWASVMRPRWGEAVVPGLQFVEPSQNCVRFGFLEQYWKKNAPDLSRCSRFFVATSVLVP